MLLWFLKQLSFVFQIHPSVEKITDSQDLDVDEKRWDCSFCQDDVCVFKEKQGLVTHLKYDQSILCTGG